MENIPKQCNYKIDYVQWSQKNNIMRIMHINLTHSHKTYSNSLFTF